MMKSEKISDARKRSISAIIPMFNEEANVKRIIEYAVGTLMNITDDWEIIIVESGSTDNTPKIVREEAFKNHRIVPFFQENREGMGSALRLGYLKVTKELVWHLESDSPFDLNDLKKALIYFDEYVGVIGYRTASKTETIFGWVYSDSDRIETFMRGMFHIGYNFLIRIVFRLKVRDVNFSFKIFKMEMIRQLDLSSNGWFIDAEILLGLKKRGAKLKEIGIEYKQREHGNSSVKFLTPILVFWELLTYTFRRWFKK